MSVAFNLILLAILSTGGPWSEASQKASTEVRSVRIEGMQFNPATVIIHSGDTVVWTNQDIVPHTVTSDSKAFDSGILNPGKSWKWKARKKGQWNYSCRLHPTMHASITAD